VAVFQPKLQEIAYNYVNKGCKLYVAGRIEYGEVHSQEGGRRRTTTVVAEEILFLSPRGGGTK